MTDENIIDLNDDCNLWTEKYRPRNLDQYVGNNHSIKKIDDWIKNFKKPETKKILLLSGPPGIGKTTIAKIILETYHYIPNEINASDFRGAKKISDLLDKYINYHSVLDLFNGGTKPNGLIMDEIDALCQGGDKGGMSEFLSILKSKKNAKTKNLNISIPIICIFNDFSDKRLKELRGMALEVRLSKPNKYDFRTLTDHIVKSEGMNIDDDVYAMIFTRCMDDYRSLITMLFFIYRKYKTAPVSHKEMEGIFKELNKKDIDVQLFDSVFHLLNKKQSFLDAHTSYLNDSIMLPMMVHENYIESLQNTRLNLHEKILKAREINNMLCSGEQIQASIYHNQHQSWELQEAAGIGCMKARELSLIDRIAIDKITYTALMPARTTRGTHKKMYTNMPRLLDTIINQTELETLAEYVRYMLFVKNDIVHVANMLQIYRISPKDSKNENVKNIDNLLKIGKSSTDDTTKLTAKIRNELSNLITIDHVDVTEVSDNDTTDDSHINNTNDTPAISIVISKTATTTATAVKKKASPRTKKAPTQKTPTKKTTIVNASTKVVFDNSKESDDDSDTINNTDDTITNDNADNDTLDAYEKMDKLNKDNLIKNTLVKKIKIL